MVLWWSIDGSCLLVVLLAAILQRSATQHIPGLICNGTQDMAVPDFLRGKQLLVYDAHWPPMAIRDETTESGWRGMDVELLEEIAAVLGFTYTILSFAPEGNETWTSELLRTTSQSDLVMSYWVRTQDRMERVTFLSGHIDSSPVLAARKIGSQSVPMTQRMTAFFHPFTWALWICIVAMILASGFIDFYLEKNRSLGIHWGSSVYAYLAGTLWGGFEYPRTIAAGVYQVVVAFLILVTISTYTANLTTFLTFSLKSTFSAASIEDVIAKELTACIVSWDANLVRYETTYPQLQYKLVPTIDEIRDQLATDSGCDGAIYAKNDFDMLRMDKETCTLRIVQTLFSDTSGWATNQQSPCVQRAIEWALRGLEFSGKVDSLYRRWWRAAECSSVPSTSSSRRLSSDGGHQYQEFLDWVYSFPWPLFRRLKGQHIGSEGAEEADGTSDVGIVGLLDYIGIFSLWGITTVIVITLSTIETRFHTHFKPILTRAGLRTSVTVPDSQETQMMQLRNRCSDRVHMRLQEMNINIDDQAGMGLNILSEILSLREDMRTQLEGNSLTTVECRKQSPACSSTEL